MTKDEALKMAIEALDTLMMEKGSIYQQAIQACKEALEQPAQQPVAWNEEEFNSIAYAYRSCPISEIDMVSKRYQELVDYVLSITYPAQPCQDLNNTKELLAQRNLELLEVQGKLLKVTLQKEVIERDYNFMRDLAIGLEEQQPAQEPLSDDEINVFINPMPQNIQNDDLREFARAIEKAHGIGE